ncbi:MAG: hypothetical protein V1807_02645 [Patescibacteria group bacterium]
MAVGKWTTTVIGVYWDKMIDGIAEEFVYRLYKELSAEEINILVDEAFKNMSLLPPQLADCIKATVVEMKNRKPIIAYPPTTGESG